jgi:hypothetical protein
MPSAEKEANALLHPVQKLVWHVYFLLIRVYLRVSRNISVLLDISFEDMYPIFMYLNLCMLVLLRERHCTMCLSAFGMHIVTLLYMFARMSCSIHDRLLIRADTCTHTHTLHSWCRQTNKDTCSAPSTRRYMHTHAQLLKCMQAHTQRSTQKTEWRYTFSSRNIQTNAQLSRRQALSTWRHTLSSRNLPTNKVTNTQHMKIPAQLLKPANKQGTCRKQTLSTWRYSLSFRHREVNEDTRSALETCQRMLSSRATYADKRSTQDASQRVQKHTHVPIWANNMQITAQFFIQAGTCRNMQSLGYAHTHAGLQYVHVTCIVPIHADACSYTLWQNAE